ncbi:MAG: Tetratricopeptide repeat protein [Betaproteobacteria bacterium ADurb.Bin341]|nr:MAG: Tetratricopeptide repeat protein [Betaproteobacteria bacterium ADurb.Bin341]
MTRGWSMEEKRALIGTALFVLVLLPFLQSVTYGAINFDDYPYTLNNPHVLRGITWDGIKYAFGGTRELGIWFPLTLFSYQIDATVWQASAQTFHLSGLIWHGLGTVVLFLLIHEVLALRFVEREGWRGLLVAAVAACWWGIHPQRVESVVWIASRKDLLSGLFAFLALRAYLLARAGDPRQDDGGGWVCVQRELAPWLFYLLAIMGKPSVMTLPLAMGCTEWLALRRISWRPLIVPFVMAVGCAGLAVYMQTDVVAPAGTERLPFWDRAVTSLASICYYGKTLVAPGELSLFYPWPRFLEYRQALLGLGGVMAWLAVGATMLLRRQARTSGRAAGGGDLAVVGLWFLGTVAPMLSLFMFGMHARADRFSYLPAVAAAVGGGVWLMSRKRIWVAVSAAFGVCLIFGIKAFQEARHWKDSVSVFERAVAVTRDNAKAYCMLAGAYTMEGNRVLEARSALRESIAIRPNSENLGLLAFLLCSQATPAELEESVVLARQALALNADEKPALAALGAHALRQGDWQGAENFLVKSLEGQSEVQPVILEWLGLARFNQKEYKGALEAFEKAAAVPGYANPRLLERIVLAREKSQQTGKGEK